MKVRGLWTRDAASTCAPSSTGLKSLLRTIILGNNQVCYIKGIGTVRLIMQDGSVKVLSDVRYIPDVKRNLISLGLLERKGRSFTSSGGRMEVRKGFNIVLVAERRNSLYYLTASIVRTLDNEVNAVKVETMKLWHMRLGHPASGSIKELAKKGIVEGVKLDDLEPCEECILGNSKKQPYPTGKHTSTARLDYVHSDLWGTAQTSTMGGG